MLEERSRIIALPLYGIGDVLMTTPALRNIKEQTGAWITYLHMFKTTKEILDQNPYVDENIYFPFLEAGSLSSARFFYGLRGRFDLSVNFYPSNRKAYSLAAFLVGCPHRVGHRYAVRDLLELNFLKNRTVREEEGLHNVEENLRLLALMGIRQWKPYPLEIHLTAEEKSSAARWVQERGLSGRPIVGFHPGTSTFKGHELKRWPEQRFAGLIDELSVAFSDAAFLLFGSGEEERLKETIREASAARDRVHLVHTPSVRDAAALMAQCMVFVSNDSGLMHMAAASQVPTVAIFGPTNPVWLRPWMCPHRAVRCGPACSPCFRYSPIPMKCDGQEYPSCIRDITVDQVLEAAASFLQGPGQSPNAGT